ncbi:MAG: histidinol-phosphatase [Akkermansia sp.]
MTDYHTHTPLCLHAEGTVEQYVQAALAQGLKEYGIADHAPMPNEPFDDWRMRQSDIPAYLDWIQRAKSLASGHPLAIKCGLECDWIQGIEPWIEHLQTLHSWDYLIGSVHYLDDHWAFDDPQSLSFWSRTDINDAWERYWTIYTQMVRSGFFQIMGHADLIGKFGYKPEGDLRRFYEPAIQAIADTGSILEINTAGWRKPCAHQYPTVEFLKLAQSANIPIAINSDAHSPQELGKDFTKAKELAKSLGFTQQAKISQGIITRYSL